MLCLWAVNSGTFLGKIGHDKELEDGGSVDSGWEEPPPRVSIAEDIGKLRIHSSKVHATYHLVLKLRSRNDAMEDAVKH